MVDASLWALGVAFWVHDTRTISSYTESIDQEL